MTTRQTVTIQGPADRDQIARWARNVETGTVVTFRKKSRSSEQSAKMWAMLGEVSAQVEWYGQKLDAEDWKDVFTASLRHARVVPGIDKGTYVPLGMHTSTLTIEEMSNLIELIYAFGAEHNVVFKEPQEPNSGSDPQPDKDEDRPSSSQEPADPPPLAGSSPNPETDLLIRYARDVLPMAADPEATGAALAAIEREYASGEFKTLSTEGLERAKAISRSMRAIFNNETTLESALGFYAEVLETTVENLRGEP